MNSEGRERAPGEVVVTRGDERWVVLVPAGVGLPGVDDVTFATALVDELVARQRSLAPVLDVSQVLGREPDVLGAVEARLELD